MKKLLLAFAIGTASLLSFTGCTKEYITNQLPGVTYTTVIKGGDWNKMKNSNLYFHQLDFPELDNQYHNFGTVQVALEFSDNKGYFNPIGATILGIHYSYDFAVGQVTIFAEDRLKETTNALDKDIKVKVTLTDADNGGN